MAFNFFACKDFAFCYNFIHRLMQAVHKLLTLLNPPAVYAIRRDKFFNGNYA